MDDASFAILASSRGYLLKLPEGIGVNAGDLEVEERKARATFQISKLC